MVEPNPPLRPEAPSAPDQGHCQPWIQVSHEGAPKSATEPATTDAPDTAKDATEEPGQVLADSVRKVSEDFAPTLRPIGFGSKPTVEAVWVAYGIPDTLVVDNGLDLASHGVRDACAGLGIDLIFTPPRSPWYKGTIERFGRTINTRLIHWLPGTTLGKPTADLGYDGSQHAVLTFEDFEGLLEQYIRTIHNQMVWKA